MQPSTGFAGVHVGMCAPAAYSSTAVTFLANRWSRFPNLGVKNYCHYTAALIFTEIGFGFGCFPSVAHESICVLLSCHDNSSSKSYPFCSVSRASLHELQARMFPIMQAQLAVEPRGNGALVCEM